MQPIRRTVLAGCVAVLALTGCSPLVEGGIGLARTSDGRLVAVLYACDDKDITVYVDTPVQRGDRFEEQELYRIKADVPGGEAVVVPLSEPPGEDWKTEAGGPLATTERRPLEVSAWDGNDLTLGRVRFVPSQLPVIDDAGAPDRVGVLRAVQTGKTSATPSVVDWLSSYRVQALTTAEFTGQAAGTC